MRCADDNQWRVGKDLEGYDRGIFKVTIVATAWENGGKN
jgi:hypothetical protein